MIGHECFAQLGCLLCMSAPHVCIAWLDCRSRQRNPLPEKTSAKPCQARCCVALLWGWSTSVTGALQYLSEGSLVHPCLLTPCLFMQHMLPPRSHYCAIGCKTIACCFEQAHMVRLLESHMYALWSWTAGWISCDNNQNEN